MTQLAGANTKEPAQDLNYSHSNPIIPLQLLTVRIVFSEKNLTSH